jgi:N-acetylmuramoyl-L-alanine amidase
VPHSESRQLKQITLDLPKPIVATAINPFIMVGGSLRQIPVNILYHNGEYYAPLGHFIDCVRDAFPYEIQYDEPAKKIIVAKANPNITGVSIEDKENGILIRISLSKKFNVSDIFINESSNWLSVDFFGGQVDTNAIFPVKRFSNSVREVSRTQLSEQAARISFRIIDEIKERQIMVQDYPSEAIISLRVRENLSQGLLAELEKEREKWKIDVVIIDPGHGGKDPGTIGRNGLREKNATLAISKAIKEELEKRLDIKVIMTRDRDVFPSLEARTKTANQHGGKLFISIHVDSNPNKSLRGHTVYFLGPAKTEEARKVAQFENSVIRFEDTQSQYADLSDAALILAANAQNSYNKESQDFAGMVDAEMKQECGSNSHGVRQGVFYVLYGASMPNILLETAFASNAKDEKELGSKEFHRSIARSICDAVIAFKKRYESELP